MVMHRALFTWFVLLIFFIFLCLRLESRMHWNWFLIFLPMWIYDAILFIDALVHIIISCKHDFIKNIICKKDNYTVFVIMLKITAQILVCLKLEYRNLSLELYHVLIPFWILLSLLIVDVSICLYKSLSSVI